MSWQLGPHPDDAPRTAVDSEREPEATPSPWRHRSVSSQVVIRPRADTREAVVLELLPLAAPALAYGATQLFLPWGVPVIVASIVLPLVAAFVVAVRDRGTLESRGFRPVAPAVLALVNPILYLAVRGHLSRGHDRDAYAPLPWAIGATVVAILAFIGVGVFFGSADQGLGDVTQLGGLLGG